MADAWPHGSSLENIALRARLLIAFADGYEEATDLLDAALADTTGLSPGIRSAAQRMRVVAMDALELVDRLEAIEYPRVVIEEPA